jgi:hypothetical protein
MTEKKKIDALTQAKLIYSGELGLFAVLFIVLGILRMVGIISPSGNFRNVFLYITLVGGFLAIGNFVWSCVSPKHRKTVSRVDAALTLPIAVFLIVIDIIQLVNGLTEQGLYNIYMGVIFVYFGLDYTYQAIYHWFKPSEAILEIVEESKKEEEAEKAKTMDLQEIQTRTANGEDYETVLKEVTERRQRLNSEGK